MSHATHYFAKVIEAAQSLNPADLEDMVAELCALRSRGGRLFLIGVGGSAANCSHAVNDFRKLCGIEAYSPVDNISELTARTNDEGWQTVFSEWMKISRANEKDAVMVFSVGGGNLEKNISPNIVEAVKLAKERGMKVLGIVGRDGGYTKQAGDCVIVIPTVDDGLITPISEGFQGVVWHGLVSHPELSVQSAKWEGVDKH